VLCEELVPCGVLLPWGLLRQHPQQNPLLRPLPKLLHALPLLPDHHLLLELHQQLDQQVKQQDVLPVQDYKLLPRHHVQPKLLEHPHKLINTLYKLI
jgi:hypothetical protein